MKTSTSPQHFHEPLANRVSRWALGIAYACQPKRAADLPRLVLWMLVDVARGGTRVPDQSQTRTRPDTFGGVCRELSPDTILAAARLGFFPWCHVGPLKWWTRRERMVMHPAQFHVSKTTKRLMKKNTYRVTFDTAFDEVIKACSGRRKNRPFQLTWITPKIMRLYSELHAMGHAHSFEVWNATGELVGGGYGLSIGRTFVTESMFSHETDTSKMGFASLNYHLAKWGYVLNDGKDWNSSLDAAGLKLMPRAEFEGILAEYAQDASPTVSWSVEADLTTIAQWEAKSTHSNRNTAQAA